MYGKIIKDLAPTAENQRNSEGSFIDLKNGDILFVYSRYGSYCADDNSPADLYACLSHDNGETFGEPYPLISCNDIPNATNIMSVTLRHMKNGDIGLFFLAKTGDTICLPYIIRSNDDGKSWSAPLCCCDRDGYFVVNNDRIELTSSGRLVVPCALHSTETGLGNGVLYIYASDDDGYSWKLIHSGTSLPNCSGCHTGVQEPGILQLNDGRLWCYIRNDSGRQYECFSIDDGETWTTPLPSAFTSAMSPMSTKRLSDGRIIAIWNPIPIYNGRSELADGVWIGARTPLVFALSSDDGKTFSSPRPIETDEKSGFCYVAIHETKDSLLLGYCAGGVQDRSTLHRLRIRKIPLSEIK